MRRISQSPFFPYFLLYIVAVTGLRYATGIIEASGNKVPDLLFMPSYEEAAAVLVTLRSSDVLWVYLPALWTLDVLFPFAYEGLLRTLMPPTVGKFKHLPICAACFDGAENLSITAFLITGEPVFVITYAVCNACKFVLLGWSAIIALPSRVWYHRANYVPMLRRLALR